MIWHWISRMAYACEIPLLVHLFIAILLRDVYCTYLRTKLVLVPKLVNQELERVI